MSTRILYGDAKYARVVEDLTAATTLTASDSGKVRPLNAAAGKAVTLPATSTISAGWNIRIQTKALFATTAWTFVAPSAIFKGGIIVNSTYVSMAGTTITMSASADTIGDYMDIVFDGTNYIVSGVGAAASSFAVA